MIAVDMQGGAHQGPLPRALARAAPVVQIEGGEMPVRIGKGDITRRPGNAAASFRYQTHAFFLLFCEKEGAGNPAPLSG